MLMNLLFFGLSSIEFQNNEHLGTGGRSVDLESNRRVLSRVIIKSINSQKQNEANTQPS